MAGTLILASRWYLIDILQFHTSDASMPPLMCCARASGLKKIRDDDDRILRADSRSLPNLI